MNATATEKNRKNFENENFDNDANFVFEKINDNDVVVDGRNDPKSKKNDAKLIQIN